MSEIKKILAPIGRVDRDLPVLKQALHLGKVHGAEVTILHIAIQDVLTHGYAYLEVDVVDPCSRKDIEDAVAKLGTELQPKVIMLEAGPVPQKTVEHAKGYDLVVMGHRHRNFIFDTFMPHKDSMVVNNAPCDVYLVQTE